MKSYIYIYDKQTRIRLTRGFSLGFFSFGAPYPGPAAAWARGMGVRGPERPQLPRLRRRHPHPHHRHFCRWRHLVDIVLVRIQSAPPATDGGDTSSEELGPATPSAPAAAAAVAAAAVAAGDGAGAGPGFGAETEENQGRGRGPADGAGSWSVDDDDDDDDEGRGAHRLAGGGPVGSGTVPTASLALRRSRRSANRAWNASSSRTLTAWDECRVLMSSLMNTE